MVPATTRPAAPASAISGRDGRRVAGATFSDIGETAGAGIPAYICPTCARDNSGDGRDRPHSDREAVIAAPHGRYIPASSRPLRKIVRPVSEKEIEYQKWLTQHYIDQAERYLRGEVVAKTGQWKEVK